MKASVYIPNTPCVREVVTKMWMIEHSSQQLSDECKLVPFGSFDLIFHLTSPFAQCFNDTWFRHPRILFTGHYKNAVNIKPLGPYITIGISLQPWAGNLFYEGSLNEITSFFADGESLASGKLLREYWYRFQHERDMKTVFGLAEEMMQKQIQKYNVNAITKKIASAIGENPDVELSKLYEKIPFSTRRIEQIFLGSTGISPAYFKKKMRLQYALKIATRKPSLKMTMLSHEAGYYDQSNFNKVFKEFTELNPTTFFKRGTVLAPELDCYLFS